MQLIDDDKIRQLVSRPDLVKRFPFLGLTKSPLSSKPCCGEHAPRKPAPDFNTIKSAIAKLLPEGRKAILEALGLDAARLVFKNGDQVVDATVRK